MRAATFARITLGVCAALTGCAEPSNDTTSSVSAPIERLANFNNDSFTDILWHNGANGQTQAWSINGTHRVGLVSFNSSLTVLDSSGWTPVGIVDVDSTEFSLRNDVIWHNGTTGQTQVWFMDTAGNRTLTVDMAAGLNVLDSSGWRLVATGMFNDDGVPDWVWHNGQTGETQIWFMDSNLNRTSVETLDSSLNVADSSGWMIVGADDMNGDFRADLVWHNGTAGQTQFWYMNASVRTGLDQLDASLNVVDSTGWRIVDINDFDKDGRADLVWHNGTSGETQIWNMTLTNRTGVVMLDSSLNVADSTGWRVVRD